MAASDPARQFIMIPFRDLDSPAFMRLARSPEFSTYLTLRRYIWRSRRLHSWGLHRWYARGYLCCALTNSKIARCLGSSIDRRTVTRDIARLAKLGMIEVAQDGRKRIIVLGSWERRGGKIVEHYYSPHLNDLQPDDA